MSRERWGAFSVIDHTDPTNLAPDVLLYDRLVFPFPGADFERKRWEDEGWQPEKLDQLIKMLGDLAITTGWTAQDQLRWSDLHQRLPKLQFLYILHLKNQGVRQLIPCSNFTNDGNM